MEFRLFQKPGTTALLFTLTWTCLLSLNSLFVKLGRSFHIQKVYCLLSFHQCIVPCNYHPNKIQNVSISSFLVPSTHSPQRIAAGLLPPWVSFARFWTWQRAIIRTHSFRSGFSLSVFLRFMLPCVMLCVMIVCSLVLLRWTLLEGCTIACLFFCS